MQRWHDWYFPRIQTVRGADEEEADQLHDDLEQIDALIRSEGGAPGEGPSDGPEDEPSTPSQGTSIGSDQADGGAGEIVDGIISGITQEGDGSDDDYDPTDLGTWDISGPFIFVQEAVEGLQGIRENIFGGNSLSCRSGKTVDDKVEICPN